MTSTSAPPATLPHDAAEFREYLLKLAARPRSELVLRVARGRDPAAAQLRHFRYPLPQPAGLVLDCVVDSPGAVVDALRAHAAEREPVLAALVEPVLSSALDVLYHSVEKRAAFDPRGVRAARAAARSRAPARSRCWSSGRPLARR